MKLKYSPFELDKEFMIQRNNKLLKHYDQLNIIRNRKNLFLPKITSPNKNKIFSPKRTNMNSNLYKNIFQNKIDKENEKICNKLNEISNRPLKNLKTEGKVFSDILNLNKKSRNKIRKLHLNLLIKSNMEIKKRINNIHPVINHNELNLQYLKTREIYKLNQKLKPCLSCGNNCLTRDDYSIIEKSKESISPDIKTKKIKLQKLGLSQKN